MRHDQLPRTRQRRRTIISVALVTVLAAVAVSCNDSNNSDVPTVDAVPSTVEPQAFLRYEALPGEPAPNAKVRASNFVQDLTTYRKGEGTLEGAKAKASQLDVEPQVLDGVGDLLVEDAESKGEIVYPQLGGFTGKDASIMLVARQYLDDGDDRKIITRTLDVRVHDPGDGWDVVGVFPAPVGDPPDDAPDLSDAAKEVLGSSRILLPDSAKRDIKGGLIDDRVLQIMAKLAENHDIAVVAVETGHPHEVFGTDKVSNHTERRAVDIWSVDGTPVVSQRDPNGALNALVKQLIADGVTELGSPWDVDGAGNISFTNFVHQDHLHLGWDLLPPSPTPTSAPESGG